MKIMKNENNGVHDKMLKMGGGRIDSFYLIIFAL